MIEKHRCPPRIAARLLEWLVGGDTGYGALGDLEEQFNEIARIEGEHRARLDYWCQVAAAVPGFVINCCCWSAVMFKNYMKTAFRNMARYKAFSLINIIGLAIGMACCILILLWIQNELSYDGFHIRADRIYRAMLVYPRTDQHSPYGPGPLAPALKEEYPEIVEASRIFHNVSKPLRYGDKVYTGLLCGVERPFFDVFTFPFVKGDADRACSDPNFIILTESMAGKLFGTENPIGKTVSFEWWGRWLEFNVTGIIKDVPHNSHLQFDYLLPFSFVTRSGMAIDRWDAIAYKAYVLLDENANPKTVSGKIGDVAKRHHADATYSISLQPLRDIHLRGSNGDGPIVYVYMFALIGALILVTACINFMNLSTARSASRAMEVGLRKVVGSSRTQLVIQFMGESILLTLLAGVFAFILVELLLPTVSNIVGKKLTLDFSVRQLAAFILIAVVTGILSGAYPALYLSRFRPAAVLKNNPQTGKKSTSLRKILIVAQFVVSITLMIGAATVSRQMSYIRHKDLGFTRECIINLEPRGDFYRQYETIKEELLRDRRIQSITMTNFSFHNHFSTSNVSWDGKADNEHISMAIRSVDYDFQKTFDIEMAEGRFFSPEHSTDQESAILINESAADYMRFDKPLGKRIVCQLPLDRERDARVIGVVKDFHFHSLHSAITPLLIVIAPWWYCDVYIKLRADDIPATIAFIEERLGEIVPDYSFEYQFLDEEITAMYATETRINRLIKYGTLLTIFISCLGLLGLSAFTAERRTKEIGIRKVLGSSATGIFVLLCKDFTKSVILANIIAWPIAWYTADRWLQGFAYRIDLGWHVFVLSGATALAVTLATVGWQTLKVARANPIDALRYE